MGNIVNAAVSTAKALKASKAVKTAKVATKKPVGELTLLDNLLGDFAGIGGADKAVPKRPVGKLTSVKEEKARVARGKASEFDTEMVFYHATRNDIKRFRYGDLGTFVTPSKKFASNFIISGSGANIIPVHVRKGKSFDYETADIDKIFKGMGSFFDKSEEQLLKLIKKGDWGVIESPKVQKIIKSNNFESYFVKEDGVKNLAVYFPEDIRSVNAKFKDVLSDNILGALTGVSATGAAVAASGKQPVGKLTKVDPQ